MVKNKNSLILGLALLVSFFGVLFWIFTPTFGNGMNGLEFADDMFNKLSKGSSYFVQKVAEKNEKFDGTNFEVDIDLEKPEFVKSSMMLLEHAGADVRADGTKLNIKGDLGKVLASALEDADAMYFNDGGKVVAKYGYEDGQAVLVAYSEKPDAHAKGEKVLLNSWWLTLSKMDKKFIKEGKIAESKITGDVLKKAVEPGYNYYGIEAKKVSEKAGIMSGLLIFYVIYTLWFGYAVFYIFDGIGLSMTKGKKVEA
ncbi:MAG: hypothetical protein QME41_10250 [Actinomycetota bacterium]|nr:hypothetical protein [Actinomycetota bacterium]